MKLACIVHEGTQKIARIEGDIAQVLAYDCDTTGVVGAVRAGAHLGQITARIALHELELCAPVPSPPRVFGIGLNYADHAAETGREPPSVQTWFMKQSTAVNRPFGIVEKPVVSDALDFEVELVVIIGARARHVPVERAHEVIAGYCVGNDYSVRDWQRATPTMIMGKGFDTHAPFGPWMVTPEEVGDLSDLRLRCFVNGVLMQNGCAADLIFKVPEMIAHLTAAMTLLPGDVIFTGTPAGVGVARTPPLFVKHGDIVRCEIDKLGMIEQRIENEVKVTVID
jgi:2-keto-4-pentenoate hydratase/2-oxohepta-3-ene-1,7-dioic acid hydratase in catechol pathway